MSLRDYTPPSRSVAIGADNKLSVRAFGFEDIQGLLINNSGLIVSALELFEQHNVDPASASNHEVRSFAMDLIAKVPGLMAELIAIAADEPDMADRARRLPAPAQLELLMAIYELTFSEPDSVGKFFSRLTDLMTSIPKSRTVTAAQPVANDPSPSGSNASGEMSAS